MHPVRVIVSTIPSYSLPLLNSDGMPERGKRRKVFGRYLASMPSVSEGAFRAKFQVPS